MKNAKKGFTLVELLVVIAILAILATVAIIGYTSFIKKAELSADQQVATQMNTVLNGESVTNVPKTVDEVLNILTTAGLNAEAGIKPSTKGYTYYWYQKHNVIVLVNDEDGSVFCPVEDEQMVSDFKVDYPLKRQIFSLNGPSAPTPDVGYYTPGTTPGVNDTEFVNEISEYGWLYSFSTGDISDPESPLFAQYEEYKSWIADFNIKANDDFAAGTMGIIGQYWSLPWTPLEAPDDIPADYSFMLLNDYFGNPDVGGNEGFRNLVTYERLVQECANGYTFNCGAYNYSEDNIGKSITVELRLYEPDENGNRTDNYIVCQYFTLTFNDVAQGRAN